MTEETRRIVIRALNEAMAMVVINLFEVLNADPSFEARQQFEKELVKVVDLRDQCVEMIGKENGDAA